MFLGWEGMHRRRLRPRMGRRIALSIVCMSHSQCTARQPWSTEPQLNAGSMVAKNDKRKHSLKKSQNAFNDRGAASQARYRHHSLKPTIRISMAIPASVSGADQWRASSPAYAVPETRRHLEACFGADLYHPFVKSPP